MHTQNGWGDIFRLKRFVNSKYCDIMLISCKGDAYAHFNFTSVIAYISTNIDDIFVLMILLASVRGAAKGRLIAGHFLGVGLITVISILGAFGLQNLPLKYVGLLGLVPIGLGIKACFDRDDDEDSVRTKGVGLLSMAMITLGNGADNVGVYIPLFTGFSITQRIGAVVIFALMTGVWVWFADTIAEFPKVKAIIEKYKRIAIPVVFIALGVFIILDSGILG